MSIPLPFTPEVHVDVGIDIAIDDVDVDINVAVDLSSLLFINSQVITALAANILG
jgi:hypothetical protein